MNKHIKILLSLSVIITFFTACGKKEKDDTENRVPEVEVALPVTESVTDYLTLPGTVQSDSKVDVVCRVSGRLLAKHVKPGDKVYKGQLLYTIESTTYRDEVKRQTAALATAKSQYAYAVSHAEALQKAYKADAVAKMQVLEAENAVVQAQASISTAEAALNDARTQLGYCNITAPISGTISETPFSTGSYINGAGNPVTVSSIVNNTDLKVTFSIEDSEYKSLPESEDTLYNDIPLTFRESLHGKYTAHLYYKSPSIEPSTGLLTLQGRINNPSPELRDGMYCTILLPTDYSSKALLVKDASIGTDQLGKYLYVVSDKDIVEKRLISVGEIWQDTLRVVTKGLNPQDRYILKALLSVKEGENVKPVLSAK